MMQDQWEASRKCGFHVRAVQWCPPGYVPVPPLVIENCLRDLAMFELKEDE